MRNLYVFGALILFLLVIAFVSRSGILSRKNPGEPANKYMRETMDTPQTPQLSTEESAVLAEKYNTATARPSGLRFLIRTPGTGEATPHSGQEVTVQYEGRFLRDGRKFDSSYDRGKPFTFMAGVGRVIPGWDAMIIEMKRGEKRTVIIPWWLAYGTRGAPPLIPPKTSLVFEIELLDFH
ncbi:MAG TPA: FKBP-type peptidyl-prolyl cis-trans isomerase [Opitutaceae bacterium]|jgi:FKBP-type peptidyl-prolyl cis-trans isomerase|nr:FKBP-type peptidyl-prolyl cis-trans isomerase [Opitutaceae bacterium]